MEHKRLSDLVYVQYNRKIDSRFQKRRELGNNFDPLVIDDFEWGNEWINNEADIVYSGEDLTWNDVDRATGASNTLEGRNLSRSARANTSNNLMTYSRRSGGSTSR